MGHHKRLPSAFDNGAFKKYKISRSQSAAAAAAGSSLANATAGPASSSRDNGGGANQVIYESNLLLRNVGPEDSGSYSCVPSSGLPNATVTLHVLKGAFPH